MADAPPTVASKHSVDRFDLTPGARWAHKCEYCGHWWSLKRGRVHPHRTDPNNPNSGKCLGSYRHVTIDVDPREWQHRHQALMDERAADALRTTPRSGEGRSMPEWSPRLTNTPTGKAGGEYGGAGGRQ